MSESILSEFNSLLDKNGIEARPAECQGMLCGLLCSRPDISHISWATLLLDESASLDDMPDSGKDVPELSAELNALLKHLYDDTVSRLTGHDYDLRLVLESDDEPLALRTEVLAEWCRGFFFGLGVSTEMAFDNMPEEVREVIQDFTQIAALSHDMEEEPEEDERAYVELVEYVRMGTLLVFQALNPAVAGPGEKDTLH